MSSRLLDNNVKNRIFEDFKNEKSPSLFVVFDLNYQELPDENEKVGLLEPLYCSH